MATTITRIMGVGLFAVGVIGLVVPDLLGLHLSVAHSLVHLVSGGVAVWIGWASTPRAARNFCVTFGAVYALLGVAGLVAGVDAAPSIGVPGSQDTHLLRVLPGVLELGLADHLVHMLLGTVLLFGGLVNAPLPAKLRAPTTPHGLRRL